MGKFLSGLIIGGLVCAFCAVCWLPINITNDVRGWVKKPAVEVIETDTQVDETQNEAINMSFEQPIVIL